MFGLVILVALTQCAVFGEGIVVPILALLFVFRVIPAIERHLLCRMFDDVFTRYSILAAISFLGLGILALF